MKLTAIILLLALLTGIFSGCSAPQETADIATTTLPVYQFTSMLCDGTGLTVTRLVTESVSCLHDYSLNVRQVKAIEAAQVVVLSGAGLEGFMEHTLDGKAAIDASEGLMLLESCHTHEHDHEDHQHAHQHDAHIWLSPANAMAMAENICEGLKARFPDHAQQFSHNLPVLLEKIQQLWDYGRSQLSTLSSREIITFHDGFAYFAQSFDLTILEAVEEESGSEASAQELIDLIHIVREYDLPAIFTEQNGSSAAASTIARETGVAIYALDMAMSTDWFEAMYHNIDTIKEALE